MPATARPRVRSVVWLCFLALAACGGSGGGNAPQTFAVGGTVSGVIYGPGTGPQLVLVNNGGDEVVHPGDGAFTFSQKLAQGAAYKVTLVVSLLEPAQTCVVQNGSGVAGPASATAVKVICATDTVTVGGTVSGLSGSGLVLANAGTALPVAANGPFKFPPVSSGTTYVVTVSTQPQNPAQTCTVTNGIGTAGTMPVTNIAVSCQSNIYSASGTVSGLKGAGLTLAINGTSTLPVSANGAFNFPPDLLADGTDYVIAAATQPTGQSCIVPNGAGTVAGASIAGVTVICAAPAFVYGAGGHGNDVLAYSISFTTGALTAIGPFGSGDTTSAVATDAAYHFLFAANQGVTSGPGSNTISAYTITAATGALVPVPNSPFASVTAPTALVVDRTSHFLYVADYHDNTVTAFSIGATGALTTIPGSPAEAGIDGPRNLTIDPSGKYLYLSVANEASVWAYAINLASGALTAVLGSPFATVTGPGPVSITPDGATAYFANTNAPVYYLTLSASPLSGSSGAFTSFGSTYPSAGGTSGPIPAGVVSVYPIALFNRLDAFALDAEGRVGFFVGRNSDADNDVVSPFCLLDCSPNVLPGAALTTQSSWVTVDPSGRFLYVSDVNGNALAYLIDRSNGGVSVAAATPGAFVPTLPFVITTQ
jgi:6-phosphogluconolactonase (cycloisomerase 2 family)